MNKRKHAKRSCVTDKETKALTGGSGREEGSINRTKMYHLYESAFHREGDTYAPQVWSNMQCGKWNKFLASHMWGYWKTFTFRIQKKIWQEIWKYKYFQINFNINFYGPNNVIYSRTQILFTSRKSKS